MNRVELSGRLQDLGALRYTPAGVSVREFRVVHASQQIEAGSPRQVECELQCVALEATARQLQEAAPGMRVVVRGFLAAKSLRQTTPVLHASEVEFDEI